MTDFGAERVFYLAARNCFSFCLSYANKMAVHLSVYRYKVQPCETEGWRGRRTTLKKIIYTRLKEFLGKTLHH